MRYDNIFNVVTSAQKITGGTTAASSEQLSSVIVSPACVPTDGEVHLSGIHVDELPAVLVAAMSER